VVEHLVKVDEDGGSASRSEGAVDG
jgi:hypothetical protein